MGYKMRSLLKGVIRIKSFFTPQFKKSPYLGKKTNCFILIQTLNFIYEFNLQLKDLLLAYEKRRSFSYKS